MSKPTAVTNKNQNDIWVDNIHLKKHEDPSI
jgi:hypothetical protein